MIEQIIIIALAPIMSSLVFFRDWALGEYLIKLIKRGEKK